MKTTGTKLCHDLVNKTMLECSMSVRQHRCFNSASRGRKLSFANSSAALRILIEIRSNRVLCALRDSSILRRDHIRIVVV